MKERAPLLRHKIGAATGRFAAAARPPRQAEVLRFIVAKTRPLNSLAISRNRPPTIHPKSPNTANNDPKSPEMSLFARLLPSFSRKNPPQSRPRNAHFGFAKKCLLRLMPRLPRLCCWQNALFSGLFTVYDDPQIQERLGNKNWAAPNQQTAPIDRCGCRSCDQRP